MPVTDLDAEGHPDGEGRLLPQGDGEPADGCGQRRVGLAASDAEAGRTELVQTGIPSGEAPRGDWLVHYLLTTSGFIDF